MIPKAWKAAGSISVAQAQPGEVSDGSEQEGPITLM
jgi:hypothetical protein